MKIIKPHAPRRSPLGRHQCNQCHSVIELNQSDVDAIPDNPYYREPGGALYTRCPVCAGLMLLNGYGAKEPDPA